PNLQDLFHPLARRHRFSSRANSSTRLSRTLPIISLPRFSTRRAHANSLPRISRPRGITIKAGPGKTSSAMPISIIVPPITPTTTRRNVLGNRSQPSRVRRFCAHFTPALYRRQTMLQLHLFGVALEFLRELGRNVRHDECVVAFVF